MKTAKGSKPKLSRGIVIVALGASAGGVPALQSFFGHVRADLGVAYVVVMHLAPDQPSALAEILATATDMPVDTVIETTTLQPDCVYVIPPGRELVIEEDSVAPQAFSQPRGPSGPINLLFESIAAGRDDGIAVLLSGEGSDGTTGARAIKAAGGIVLAQNPEEAEHSAMPRSAIANGVVDVIAPVADLAERIADIALSRGGEETRALDEGDEPIRNIIRLLHRRVGHDFAHYKPATVRRRIERRMQLTQKTNLADYAAFLQDSEKEAQDLFSDMLISVTSFFRDAEHFDVLAQKVVAPLFDRHEDREDPQIRAWSVGCATGEEAYSLAMLLAEEADRRKTHVPIQVFATDVDDAALMKARHGVYDQSIEGRVSEARRKRFFVQDEGGWRVRKELRDMVLFARHNVLTDPPFMKLDIAICRNVLIYLDRKMQRQVCGTLHYALREGGALMLGTSETDDTTPELFRTIDRDARIYDAGPGSGRAVATLPQQGITGMLDASKLIPKAVEPDRGVGLSHISALEATAPPSALVGSDLRVLHLSPTAGRFLMPSGGAASLKMPDLARPELRLDLKLALHRAFEDGQSTLTLPADVAVNGSRHRVVMQVSPAPEVAEAPPRAVVLFLDGGPIVEPTGVDSAEPGDLRRLQEELRTAQERLVASRSEHDLAMQDLRAANEELQSINEEYRSTSEELETSKEELQSMNEELQTVNTELNSNLESVSSAHSDLRNLVDATEIGTLFLDGALRIRMFTPRVREIFNLAAEDIGRKITDFSNKLVNDSVVDDTSTVIERLIPKERDAQTTDGRCFTVRTSPYRTLDDHIDGVVISFVDITAARKATEEVHISDERFTALLAATTDVAFRMDPDWSEMRMLRCGSFLADTSEPRTDWMEAYFPEEDHARLQAAINKAIVGKSLFELENRVIRNDGSIGWALSRAAPIIEQNGSIREWFGIASDVTARKGAEKAQTLLAELNHRVKNMLTVILSIAEQTRDDAPSLDAYAEALEDRVRALADAHDALTRTEWKGASLDDLAQAAIGIISATERERVSISGPAIELGSNATTIVRLALHELCTNALKYGSLSVSEGRVAISWRAEGAAKSDSRRLILEWRESGGPSVSPPEHRGFGSNLLESGLPRELNGTAHFSFEPEGLFYRLATPFYDQVRDG